MSESSLLLQGATLLTMDSAARVHRGGDLLVRDGRIAAVGRNIEAVEGAERIDLSGCVLMPGLIQAPYPPWPDLLSRSGGGPAIAAMATRADLAARGGSRG